MMVKMATRQSAPLHCFVYIDTLIFKQDENNLPVRYGTTESNIAEIMEIQFTLNTDESFGIC